MKIPKIFFFLSINLIILSQTNLFASRISDPPKAPPPPKTYIANFETISKAIKNRNINLLRTLIPKAKKINQRDKSDNTLMHISAQTGDKTITLLLLEHGAWFDYFNLTHGTPKRIAKKNKHKELTKLFSSIEKLFKTKDSGETEEILKTNISPNIKNSLNQTPLHFAASNGNLKKIKILLQYGADPNIRNAQGKTALYKAIEERHDKLIEPLIKSGAIINTEDNDGFPLLGIADTLQKELINKSKEEKIRKLISQSTKLDFPSKRSINCVILLDQRNKEAKRKNRPVRDDFESSLTSQHAIIIASGSIVHNYFANQHSKTLKFTLSETLSKFRLYKHTDNDALLFVFVPFKYEKKLTREWKQCKIKPTYKDFTEHELALGIAVNDKKILRPITKTKDLDNFLKMTTLPESSCADALISMFIEKTKNRCAGMFEFYLIGHGSEKSVASLSIPDIKKIIMFFNNKINVRNLFLLTCYGKQHLFTTYQQIKSMGYYKQNFTIYNQGTSVGKVAGSKIKKKDFFIFFSLLEKQKSDSKISIEKALKYLNPSPSLRGITNNLIFIIKPNILIPIPINIDKKRIRIFTYTDDQTLKINKKDIDISSDTKVFLVSPTTISRTINIPNDDPEKSFLSIRYGNSTHFINGLHFQKTFISKQNFINFVYRYFFYPTEMMRLKVQKTFVFKKITFSSPDNNKSKKLHNVVLTIGPSPKNPKETTGLIAFDNEEWKLPQRSKIPYSSTYSYPLDLLKKTMKLHPSLKIPLLTGQEDYYSKLKDVDNWNTLWKIVGIPNPNQEQKEKLKQEIESVEWLEKNKSEVATLIKKAITLGLQDLLAEYPLHSAIQNKDHTIIKMILESQPNINLKSRARRETTLHRAVRHNLIDLVLRLLKAGANPNIPNRVGRTPLHDAATIRKNTPIEVRKKIIIELLKNRANKTIKDNRNKTPRDLAIKSGHSEIAKLLK